MLHNFSHFDDFFIVRLSYCLIIYLDSLDSNSSYPPIENPSYGFFNFRGSEQTSSPKVLISSYHAYSMTGYLPRSLATHKKALLRSPQTQLQCFDFLEY